MHVSASLRHCVYKTLKANQEEVKSLLISLATATFAAASSISSSSAICKVGLRQPLPAFYTAKNGADWFPNTTACSGHFRMDVRDFTPEILPIQLRRKAECLSLCYLKTCCVFVVCEFGAGMRHLASTHIVYILAAPAA